MEVTDKNLLTIIDEITEDIKLSDFISIDSEFTGLEKTDPFDTPTEYYDKIIENDSEYIIIQLGLTIFRKINDAVDNKTTTPTKYEYKTYNFYVYPRLREQMFKCRGESMSFLALHGFDFNKLFANGISSCNSKENQNLLEKLAYKQILDREMQNVKMDEKDRTAVPDSEVEHLKKIKNKIDLFVKCEDQKKLIELPECSAFQRKLVYEMVNLDYDGLISKTINKNNEKIFTVQRIEIQNNDDGEQANIKEYNEFAGIHNILKALSNSKKLIIGHNMILDLMYIIRQFFQPLPKNYNKFKKLVRKLFPNLIDTKYICTLGEFQSIIPNSKLCELYKTVTAEPFELPEIVPQSPEFGYPNDVTNNLKEHEAGYDSYQTGVCFISILNHINLSFEHVFDVTTVIYPCLNKICTQLFNVNYINLMGSENVSSRTNVFYIKFPTNWTAFNIKKLFKPFGDFNIVWISNIEAYVSIKNQNIANTLLENIQRPSDFYISTHEEYKANNIKNFAFHYHNDDDDDDDIINLNKRPLSDQSQPPDTDDNKLIRNSTRNTGKKSKSTETPIQLDNQKKIFIEYDEW